MRRKKQEKKPRKLEKQKKRTPRSSSAAGAAYAKHVDTMHRRHATESLSHRDIREDYPDDGNADRRNACRTSLMLYYETYAAHAFPLPWSVDHRRIIGHLQDAILKGGSFAEACPRGDGKTQRTIHAAIWAILYGHVSFECLIGATQDDADKLLEGIKGELQDNELLLEDFPFVCYPIRRLENESRKVGGQLFEGQNTLMAWGKDRIVLPTLPSRAYYGCVPTGGSVITVDGITGALRGKWHRQVGGRVIRPQFVLIDDFQTRESAMSVTMTNQRLQIIRGDVLRMAGPGKNISAVVNCTVICKADGADQLIDRSLNPSWHGEKTKLCYAFPTDEAKWAKYGELRADSFRADHHGEEATEFYKRDQAAMDEGAQAAWPERFNPDEISAIQNIMNLRIDDPSSFYAEYQNEPSAEQTSDDVLTADQLCQKASNLARGVVPVDATCLTGFVDVHDKLLYWVICAWWPGFNGHVVDYGTYPEQAERSFVMRTVRKTLAMQFPKMGPDGAIQAGLEALVPRLLGEWKRPNGTAIRPERVLIDSGYKPGIVANVVRKFSGLMASKGAGIKAGQRPMSVWPHKPGEKAGDHWYVPNVKKLAEFPFELIDTNYWKSFVHARFRSAPGDPASWSIWGTPGDHAMFGRAVAESERWVLTRGHGRDVQEWSQFPAKPDNHLFDCMVGAATAASMCGIKMGTEMPDKPKRVVVSFAEQARQAREQRERR